MANFILLLVSFTAGILLRRSGRFPAATPAALNGFIIHISLPAVALLHVHRLKWDPAYLYAGLMAWVLFGLGVLFFRSVGRIFSLPGATTGALILVGGLGNTSFVGLPMIETWYGRDLLSVGVIADQLGSFMVLSTVGIATAAAYSSGNLSWRQMARKILLFPPFQGLLIALLLRPVPFHPVVETVLQRLADTITPLALVSVGLQLRLVKLRGALKPLSLGLFYKLFLGPALVTLLFAGLLGGEGEVMQVTVFEAAMAPMITAGIIAVDHDLDPPLVTLMLGIGIPLSFLTLPAWWWFLRGI